MAHRGPRGGSVCTRRTWLGCQPRWTCAAEPRSPAVPCWSCWCAVCLQSRVVNKTPPLPLSLLLLPSQWWAAATPTAPLWSLCTSHQHSGKRERERESNVKCSSCIINMTNHKENFCHKNRYSSNQGNHTQHYFTCTRFHCIWFVYYSKSTRLTNRYSIMFSQHLCKNVLN